METCLLQEKFEKYCWDYHIGTSTWYHLTTLVAKLRTALPQGSHPEALQVTTHGQQEVSSVGILPLCRDAVSIFTAPVDRTVIL